LWGGSVSPQDSKAHFLIQNQILKNKDKRGTTWCHEGTSLRYLMANKENESREKQVGRPPLHQDKWARVSVVLLNDQVVFLDRLATDIREKTGKPVKRSEILRALTSIMVESPGLKSKVLKLIDSELE
jgi:hypothetical protein